ncbi:hypothetical protein [Bradyrhizobium sp. CCGUVB23]|uniref:hypothetical protein n=1 Tax=Bradyrhizobium sp. CCGUVB23 TaxID=2949630 RepID=UPI0020B1E7E4|nr:hypothetical protein [Bradyrhizobium sp. CCGUVB23]MCP3463076.1 hypothetical protein [Bradyrhizobium sp. CCGUVB23]
MNHHTWTTRLTLTTDDQSFADVRDWLKENDTGNIPPRRNDDVLAKYLRCVLISNSEWDKVGLGIQIDRPRPARLPWQQGYEGDAPPLPEAVRDQRAAARRRQFAVDCFALAMMLIVGATVFVARSSRNHHQASSLTGYTASHDVMARPQTELAGAAK